MPTFNLVPRPGFSPNLGSGTVEISGNNIPYLINGDAIEIKINGMLPGQQEVGHLLPGDSTYIFDGLMTNGSITIADVVRTYGLHSILDSPALIITNGIIPQNGNLTLVQPGIRNPWNTSIPCQYGLQNSPIPAIPGIDNLVAEVEASWNPPHVSVANVRVDMDSSVSYLTAPPDAAGPYLTTVPNGECLSLAASVRIAVAIGGTVISRPARVWKDIYVYPAGSPQPNVNWISAPGLGSAQGSDIAHAFDTRETASLKQNILATFQTS